MACFAGSGINSRQGHGIFNFHFIRRKVLDPVGSEYYPHPPPPRSRTAFNCSPDTNFRRMYFMKRPGNLKCFGLGQMRDRLNLLI